MKIIRADVLGFCMGVRRAQEIAVSEAKNSGCNHVYTLGPLVHNPKVLADLKERGVETLTEISGDLSNSTVIIRAHGISPQQEESLRVKGARIVDATCPKVKKSQLKAKELAQAGYGIFLAGETHHAEIQGIVGYAQDAIGCVVLGDAEEAEAIAKLLAEKKPNDQTKVVLLGQTTISEEEYSQIATAVKKYFPNLEVIDTICSATTERQQALKKLLDNPEVEAVIIAGGKESANSKRLLSIAKESGKPCCLVESSAEIPDEFFNYETVGLSAGASTPDCVIDEIEKKLAG